MAVKFELTENHIKLLQFLDWEIKDDNTISTKIENDTPYGGLSLIDDIGLILYGKPDGDFDPLSPYGPQYSDEQKKSVVKIYSELNTALEIIHFLRTFETGTYKRKWNVKNWSRVSSKN